MTFGLATAGPSAYWYLTRSTGGVSLILLTASVVLGVIDVSRWSTPRWPRFALDSLHRSVSMLALVFLGLHILTAALDSFAPISPVDAVVPFIGSYRPFWLGLGAVAFDLMLAIVITSVMRRRVGHRAWRITHWLAYACWPIALLHTLGTGSDVKRGWLLALSAACLLAVLAAVLVRINRGWAARTGLRGGALAVAACLPIGLLVWLPGGPLGSGWARRSGTPAALLGSAASSSHAPTGGTSSSSAGSQPGALDGPFHANLSGSVNQGPGPEPGLVAIKIATTFNGAPAGLLGIEIVGEPLNQGVSLRSSRVTLGSSATPSIYQGVIVQLSGNRMVARVKRSDGRQLSLEIALQINSGAGSVAGTMTASPAAAAKRE
jgi:sulfoxide reductase heme-binding subunit YedZ